MSKKSKLVNLVLFLGLFLVLTGCGTQKEESKESPTEQVKTIQLRHASFIPANSIHDQIMVEFSKLVEERTNGRVKVENFPGGTLLQVNNMYEGVLQGTADLGFGQPSVEPGRFPMLTFFDMPLGFPNTQVTSAIMRDILNEFDHEFLKDFKVITVFSTTPGYIMTKKRVQNLNDLKGLEIRAPGPYVPVLQALGAVAIGMPMSEVPQALQMGIVNGIFSTREVLKEFKFGDIVKYVVDYPFNSSIGASLMSKKVWDKLPPDVQKVIEEVGLELSKKAPVMLDSNATEAMDWSITNQGVQMIKLSDEEKAKWDALLKPLVDAKVTELETKGLPGKELYKKVYELNEKYSKELS